MPVESLVGGVKWIGLKYAGWKCANQSCLVAETFPFDCAWAAGLRPLHWLGFALAGQPKAAVPTHISIQLAA